MEADDGTVAVREGEGIDATRLARFLREHLPGVPDGPVEVRQFPSGASNLTYRVCVGGWEAVLRRPPLGPVAPRAHDVLREAALLAKLHPAFPLAPRPLAVCDDPAVLGAPFFLMERLRGVVLDARFPRGVTPSPALGRRVSEAVVDTLAALHAVDFRAAGLAELGRPEGFLRRQLEGWAGRYQAARTAALPEVEPLVAWLGAHLPESPATTLIHNDFKLNNLLLDADDPGRVVGVVDWEMATLGDPLFDLAVSLGYWVEADDPPELRALVPTVTTSAGFLTRRELVARYAERSGRSVERLDWYSAFAHFKLAVILQQIHARWVRGQTRDPRFATFDVAVHTLVRHALGVATAAP